MAERGLDFADAEAVFDGDVCTVTDDRRDYGEVRFQTAGYLRGRFVMLIWTHRNGARHVISMRFGHAKEEQRYRDRLG